MALPWTDPTLGHGIYPAQAPFFIPGTVDPRLIALISADRERQQQQISQAAQSALSGLGQMIQQHQQDAIASQLLAGSAPKAEAVNQPAAQAQQPAVQPGPSQSTDYTDPDTGVTYSPTGQAIPRIAPATPPASLASFQPVGTPSATLSPTEAAQNAALGFATRQLLRPAQQYASQQALESEAMDTALQQAKIDHLNRLGFGPGTPGQAGSRYINYTDPTTGQTIPITGNAYLNMMRRGKSAPTTSDLGNKLMGSYGLTADDLNNIDVAKSDVIPPKGNAGQKMSLVTTDGKQATIPWNDWQRITNFARQGQAPSGAGGSIPRLSSPDQARQLPSGSLFYDSSGTLRRVP